MDPLSGSASVITLLQLTSTVIKYLSDVRDGPKELQRIRLEISSILNILMMLQDQADQAKYGDSLSSSLSALDVPNGPFEQFRAALERLASKLAPVEGWRKFGKAFKWPFEKEEIRGILNIIERQKAIFSLARQNDHIALSKTIEASIKNIHKGVNEFRIEVTNLQTDEKHKKIQQWLSAPNPSSNYNTALKNRHATTGDWFLKTDAYLGWLFKPKSLLWLYGIPGCGKTILSSSIVQRTLSECRLRSNAVVLYFYFDFNDVEKQQHERLIRSLIFRLFSQCVSVPPVLESLYSSCMDGRRQPAYNSLLATLHQMMLCFTDTYLVLDALDECLERQELLTSINEFSGWEDVNLHILTTSRMEKDIEESMEALGDGLGKICIQSILINGDIRAYVRGRLQTDQGLKRWREKPEIQLEIEDKLMDKAGGM